MIILLIYILIKCYFSDRLDLLDFVWLFQVYRLLFGSKLEEHILLPRKKRSLPDMLGNIVQHFDQSPLQQLQWQSIDSMERLATLARLAEMFHGDSLISHGGLLAKLLENNPQLLLDPEFNDILQKVLGLKKSTSMDTKEVVDVLMVSFYFDCGYNTLETYTCKCCFII